MMRMACEHTSKYSTRDIEPRGFQQDVSPTGAKRSTRDCRDVQRAYLVCETGTVDSDSCYCYVLQYYGVLQAM